MHVWVFIYTNASRRTFEQIFFGVTVRITVELSYLSLSHVTHTSESCHTRHTFENTVFENLREHGFWCHYQGNSRALHARLIHESCHTYARGTLHVPHLRGHIFFGAAETTITQLFMHGYYMSHVTHKHEARCTCPTFEDIFFLVLLKRRSHSSSCTATTWVMSHIWMSHITSTNESHNIFENTIYEWSRHSLRVRHAISHGVTHSYTYESIMSRMSHATSSRT